MRDRRCLAKKSNDFVRFPPLFGDNFYRMFDLGRHITVATIEPSSHSISASICSRSTLFECLQTLLRIALGIRQISIFTSDNFISSINLQIVLTDAVSTIQSTHANRTEIQISTTKPKEARKKREKKFCILRTTDIDETHHILCEKFFSFSAEHMV